ncbi:MAG: bifunctional response regulator/alkaline phosphatase family protein [Bacteroidetes bacterium]|nr:bifunctional response regulator/alkaline phosphatase family protein [Bacteroidota bacterium]MCB0846971.1 bifunctional response regulator/alkaline phosphatase family protein [Bacteroidota bacterium]
MPNARILWVDDEIDLLKAHIMFLKEKGFDMESASNGIDALEMIQEKAYDIVFLDEQMPGMDGLTVLSEIQKIKPNTPVIMITKSEEEQIMEDALGAQITDYLIKPVKPTQILLACKKILENKRLVTEHVNLGYQQDFRNIAMQFFEDNDFNDWVDIYRKLMFWEGKMEENEDKSMEEVLINQLSEANENFGRFVGDHYLDWLHTKDEEDRPILSPDLIPRTAFPLLDEGYESVFFILVDCLRYDQWKAFEPIISELFYIQSEQAYYGILPTATQYARNAIFSGMMPLEISQRFSKYWLNDDEDGGKNNFEAEFFQELVSRHRLNIKTSYHKIITNEDGKNLADNIHNLFNNDLNVIVYNFIDLLSHSRTEMNIIRELAPNEAAYRSISRSWLEFSPLLSVLKTLSKRNVRIILTTDHGTIRVKRPTKIIGDRTTTTNLRYKQGKNLNYDEKDKHLFTVRNPKDAFLPQSHVSSTYVFAMEDHFFAYPNNYNYYVNHYKDTFQHGGISMEEMIIPIVDLIPKGR